MGKRFSSPRDLSPSFKQWEALVKVYSSVFSQSTLGPRIHQLLKFGGYCRPYPVEQSGHPKDMAEVLLAVGSVARGALEEISITGGPGCSWVAAFADQVLGLKVAVRSDEGAMPWMNYDGSVDQGQISLCSCDRESTKAISCVGRMFYVRHGYEFIRECFEGRGNIISSASGCTAFLGGRMQWDTMFSETFGRDFEDLVNISAVYPAASPVIGKELSAPVDMFAQMFLAGAAYFVFHTTEACRYRDITEFVLSAMSAIPELRPCKHRLLDPTLHIIFSAMSLEELCLKYGRSSDVIARPYERDPRRNFCRAQITQTIVILTYLLGRIALEGSLLPKRSGILNIYYEERVLIDNEFLFRRGNKTLGAISDREEHSMSLNFLLARYVSIFSGELAQYPNEASMSALSDGKVYCFVNTLHDLSNSFAKASIMHVGAGSIQVGNRLHEYVYDEDHPRDHYSTTSQTQRVQRVAKNLCPFIGDSTSTDLSIGAAVEESVRLSFWYRVSSKLGVTIISPGSFVQTQLR